MKRQWELYAPDSKGAVSFLVVSSDAVNDLFPYVTVIPVVPRAPEREVYPIEAVVPGVRGASVALVHQIRTLRSDRLTERRGVVEDEAVRHAVREAMSAYFGF